MPRKVFIAAGSFLEALRLLFKVSVLSPEKDEEEEEEPWDRNKCGA